MPRFLEGKRAILSYPVTAVILGLIAGTITLVLLVIFPKFAPKGNFLAGFALSFVGIICSLAFGGGALYLYHSFAKVTFVWFGVSAIVAYFVGISIYAVQNIRKLSVSNTN